MSAAPSIDTNELGAAGASRRMRVLIEQPDGDIRELLAEHCLRLGFEPVIAEPDLDGRLGHVDVIVAEPVGVGGQRILAAHSEQRSRTPIVFASIYPPAGGLLRSPAVAHLVMPCSRERFEQALSVALAVGAGGR